MMDVPSGIVEPLPSTVKALERLKLNGHYSVIATARAKMPDAYTTGNIRMDIYLPGYTKGKAVRYLSEKLGIDFEDTFAFGDACNDVEMLKIVKYGIAMGNGTEEIKAIAFDITDDVANDGIYNALIKYKVI